MAEKNMYCTVKSGIIILLLFFAIGMDAQRKEAYNWYFGAYVGMTWNTTQTIGGLSGLPTPLPPSAMTNQQEGVFGMSDADGNLLFYSDGMTIWNRNHTIMTNGSGLLGNWSSAQSGIVVPYPGQNDLYIAFTLGLNSANNLSYSIIDMTLDGGLGAVTSKNIQLTGALGNLGESVAAVRNSNGRDYWIVAPGKGSLPNSTLNVWSVTTAGVQTTCMASYPLPQNTNGTAGANGYLRFSANGKHFAWAEHNGIAVFFGTFDPSTGTFPTVKVMDLGAGVGSYGTEFSSSNEILFVMEFTNRNIHAFKFADLLNSPDPTNMPHRIVAATPGSGENAAIQLGPDGRIYGVVYSSQSMFVIEDVDDYDNFTPHVVNGLLTPGPSNYQARLGLPNFMAHYFTPVDNTCTYFTDDIWYFGTGGGGIAFQTDGGGDKVAVNASGESLVSTGENSLSVSSPGCGSSLIYYTQHNKIYNALHQEMQDGTFSGNASIADGLAACFVGDNKYMLFSVTDAYSFGPMGLEYHIIDMSEDNGYGKRIFTGVIESSGLSESIELVPVYGKADEYWLIYRMYDLNEIRVRKVTGTTVGGIVDTQPLSATGASGISFVFRANQQYDRLALAFSSPTSIVLFDFDTHSGNIEINRTVTPPFSSTYGVEFSPDGNYVYCANWSGTNQISQYDITNNTFTPPFAYGGAVGGGLKLGADGRLYVKRGGRYMGVIADPDAPLTQSGYEEDGFDLGVGINSGGLTFSTGLTPPAVCPDGLNTAPVAVDDVLNTCMGSAFCVNVLRNDYDPDGDQISLIEVRFANPSDASRMSIAVNTTDSTVCVTPNGSFTVGEEIELIYTIRDNSSNPIPYCNEATLTIVVTEAYAPQMQSQAYIACPDAVVRIEIAAASQPGYIFKWYDASTGGNLLATGTYYDLVKDNNTVQSVWVESIPAVGSVCERTQVDVLLSESCGDVPTDCAVNGTILFREDFGGNNTADPWRSSTSLGSLVDYIFCDASSSSSCIQGEGTYAITKRSIGHTSTGWHADYSDHTYPNDITQGYMFQVNAGWDPGKFYEAHVDGLCDGSRLYFSAWLANLIYTEKTGWPLQPYLRFEISDLSDNILATYYTGELPRTTLSQGLTWALYGFDFVVPPGISSVKCKIFNNGEGGSGNDFVMDDIEIRLCVPPVTLSGKADYCPGENINLTGSYTDDGTFGGGWQMRWLYSATGDLTSFAGWSEVATGTTLNQPMTAGFYRAVVGTQVNLDGGNYNCCAISDVIKVGVVPNLLYWKSSAPDSNWNDPANWADAAAVVMNAVPRYCTDVHIPGNASAYPSLDVGNTIRTPLYGEPECHDIYFHFGGEVAKPHLLTYNKAFIEYNFGYFDNSSVYQTDGDSHSATPMLRGRWYALATPLNKITPGDFSFGGKPDAWQQAFIRNNISGSFAGQWDVPHNANSTDIPEEQYGGIAVWMADVVPGSVGEDASYHTNLNDLQGIIRMPYFEDAYLGAFQTGKHRIHEYVGGESRFYYYWSLDPTQPIEFTNPPPSVISRANEAYRFVFDGNLPSTYISSAGDNYPTFHLEVPAGKELMIGNPFLSNLDFDKFWEINQSHLAHQTYRVYDNTGWTQQYTVGSGGTGIPPLTGYIAPLQAFFIETQGSGNVNLLFPPDLVSVTVPSNKLRASENRFYNVLYVEASNNEGNSWITLGMKEGVNVDYLFNNDPLYVNVPQLYVSDSNRKNAVQFISGETEIPLGIRSQTEGIITLRFRNVDQFYVESLTLEDKVSGDSYDLLRGANEIEFANLPDSPDRFVLKVGKQTVGTEVTKKDSGVLVRADRNKWFVESSEIIQQIAVMNMQGIYFFNNPFVNNTHVAINLNVPPGVYIVKVVMKNGENRVKKVIMNYEL